MTITTIKRHTPRPITRAQPEIAQGQGKDVLLRMYPGIGDVLLAMPFGYAFKETDPHRRVGLGWHCGKGSRFPVSMPDMAELPGLPLLDAVAPDAHTIDLRALPSACAAWRTGEDLLDGYAKDTETALGSTPRYSCLRATSEHRQIVRQLVGQKRYLLLGPRGHFASPDKAMTRAQMRAVVRAARAARLAVVAVHDTAEACPREVLDLSGKLTLRELVALCGGAAAAACVDSGPMHLTAGFRVPTLGLFRSEFPSSCFADRYRPFAALDSRGAIAEIPPRVVGEAMRDLLLCRRAKATVVVPPRQTCGVAEHGRDVAEALGWDCAAYGEVQGQPLVLMAYHAADQAEAAREAARLREQGTSIVMDVHHLSAALPDADAYIVHNLLWERQLHDAKVPVYYIPLHAPEWAQPCERSRSPSIGWWGLLQGHKRLDRLVAAFCELRERVPGAELRIVGSIPEEDSEDSAETVRFVESLKGDPGIQVHCEPYHQQDDLRQILSGCWLYCFPYAGTGEGNSWSVSGALSFERPVVVSGAKVFDDVRPWAVTHDERPGGLRETIIDLVVDSGKYHEAQHRARLGASYRKRSIVAREYEAVVGQAALEC